MLRRAHIPLNLRNVSGFIRNIKNDRQNTRFVYLVEFQYFCTLSCVDDFQPKMKTEHTIWKSHKKLEPWFLALSPPQLMDGLL